METFYLRTFYNYWVRSEKANEILITHTIPDVTLSHLHELANVTTNENANTSNDANSSYLSNLGVQKIETPKFLIICCIYEK